MAIKFADLKGKASKSGPPRMKLQDGLNTFRIVSSIVPGYKYWVKSKDGTSIPIDCLGFNKETEEFDNKTTDWVKHFFPGKNCSWAYTSFVIDRADGKLKILDHKKKLLGQVISAAEKKFGDPSDPEAGWDIIATRKKTGPKVFDVEYTLEVFDIEPAPLSDEDKELLVEMPDIEEFLKSPTPEVQKEFIEKYILGDGEDKEDDDEAPAEFGQNTPSEDDIPM
jgi:hypothetical protein